MEIAFAYSLTGGGVTLCVNCTSQGTQAEFDRKPCPGWTEWIHERAWGLLRWKGALPRLTGIGPDPIPNLAKRRKPNDAWMVKDGVIIAV